MEPMLQNTNFSTTSSTKRIGQIAATISVCLSILSSGTALSWTSPVLPELQKINSTTTFHVTVEEGSWIVGLIKMGAFFSALPAGLCANKFGRKRTLLLFIIPLICSWLLIILSYNIWFLYVARFLAGVCLGGACVLAPIYISEIAENDLKGPLGSCLNMFSCFGLDMTFIIVRFVDIYWLSVILTTFPILFFVTFIFMPESPIYLVKTGKIREAMTALKFLRGKDADVHELISIIREDIDFIPKENASLIDILKNKIYFRCLIACLILSILNQTCGYNVVILYSVSIFQLAQSYVDPVLSSIIICSTQVIAIFLFIFVVDKQGRKTYLLLSLTVCCLTLTTLAISFQLQHLGIEFYGANIIPIISLIIFIFSFSTGLGTLPWVILGELVSVEIIGTISSVMVMVTWFTGFVISKNFPIMLNNLGPYITFYIFAVFNVFGVIFTYLFVPETKGRHYHEIYSSWKK